MERTDVVPGRGETIVYNLGTLYGEWPDGTPFEGNRYVDRFVVRGGKIVQMDVWNDSAERLLLMRGIDVVSRRSIALARALRRRAAAAAALGGIGAEDVLDVALACAAAHDQRAARHRFQVLVHHGGRRAPRHCPRAPR